MADARRDFVPRLARGAGWGAALLGLLDGTVLALPKSEETDLANLDASLALEHEAIAIYEAALSRNLFLAGLRTYAVEFVGDHKGHRDTQLALAEAAHPGAFEVVGGALAEMPALDNPPIAPELAPDHPPAAAPDALDNPPIAPEPVPVPVAPRRKRR